MINKKPLILDSTQAKITHIESKLADLEGKSLLLTEDDQFEEIQKVLDEVVELEQSLEDELERVINIQKQNNNGKSNTRI